MWGRGQFFVSLVNTTGHFDIHFVLMVCVCLKHPLCAQVFDFTREGFCKRGYGWEHLPLTNVSLDGTVCTQFDQLCASSRRASNTVSADSVLESSCICFHLAVLDKECAPQPTSRILLSRFSTVLVLGCDGFHKLLLHLNWYCLWHTMAGNKEWNLWFRTLSVCGATLQLCLQEASKRALLVFSRIRASKKHCDGVITNGVIVLVGQL